MSAITDSGASTFPTRRTRIEVGASTDVESWKRVMRHALATAPLAFGVCEPAQATPQPVQLGSSALARPVKRQSSGYQFTTETLIAGESQLSHWSFEWETKPPTRIAIVLTSDTEAPQTLLHSANAFGWNLPQPMSASLEADPGFVERAVEYSLFALEVNDQSNEDDARDQLVKTVLRYGEAAVGSIHTFIASGRIEDTRAAEALRVLGEITDGKSHSARLWLLGLCLSFPSPRIRYGAMSGLASMDDPLAIVRLEAARNRETHRDLKRVLDRVITQLQETADHHGSVVAQDQPVAVAG
jgi:hypothetical protein